MTSRDRTDTPPPTLPPYGADSEVAAPRVIHRYTHTPAYQPRRRRWPGILAAGLIGAGIAAAAVSSYYDSRTLGQRLDASVDTAERTVQQQVEGLKSGASAVAQQGARTTEELASTFNDASITAAVKTALAADPALSALKIDVSTQAGIVTLAGPAPDEKARERAAVIAAAPEGVRSVDNRLVVASLPSS